MSKDQTPAAEAPATPPVVTEPIAPTPPPVDTSKVAAPPVEVKPGEEVKPPGDAAKPAEAIPPETPKPPEKFELKARKDSPLQKTDLEEIEALAKAKGLSQEDAQKLVESREADHERFFSRQREMAIAQQQEWRKTAETDKEIAGSDGKAFKENVEIAHRALHRFADDAFKKVLSETGLGNNPHLIRTFLRIGKGMANDRAVTEGQTVPPGKNKSRESKLYPTHNKKED